MPSIFSRRTPSDRSMSGRRTPSDRPISGRQTPFDQSMFNRQARSDRSIFSRRTSSDQPVSGIRTPFDPPVTDRDSPSSKGSIWSKKNPYLGKGKPALPSVALEDTSFLGNRRYRDTYKGKKWARSRPPWSETALQKLRPEEREKIYDKVTEKFGAKAEDLEFVGFIEAVAKDKKLNFPSLKNYKKPSEEKKKIEKEKDLSFAALGPRQLNKRKVKEMRKYLKKI